MIKEFGYEEYQCKKCGVHYSRLKLVEKSEESDVCPPCENRKEKDCNKHQ